MVPRGQELDREAAFADSDAGADDTPDEDSGDGGGLFGALGRLGALAGAGDPSAAGPGAGSAGQTEFGGAHIEHDGYEPGAPDAGLFMPPGPPYREITL